MPDFVKVASLSELEPGSAKAVEVAGRLIALFNVGGTIYALDNTCLHQGGPLSEGILDGEVIMCPWHMWEYNVRTGEKVGVPEMKVESFPVRVEGNDIQVAI